LSQTAQIDIINGQHARIWEGVDDTGTPIKAWIVAISPQTHDAEVIERFALALRELKTSGRSEIFDMRFFID